MTHLHALFSSHLAGSCSAIHDARHYERCKKSLFFALKSCKFRIVFHSIFVSKPMQKCNIFPVFIENLCNILQNKILRVLQNALAITFGIAATPHNLLTCKILTQGNKKNKEKVQKSRCFFTRFLH